MGKNLSKPLREATADDVATAVAAVGPTYGIYAERIQANAVDGDLLASLEEIDFDETLDDLDVCRLHKRVLTKEWRVIMARDQQKQHDRMSESFSSHASWTERTCTCTAFSSSPDPPAAVPLNLNLYLDGQQESSIHVPMDPTGKPEKGEEELMINMATSWKGISDNDDVQVCYRNKTSSPFPSYVESLASGKPLRTATLPSLVNNENRATRGEEMAHLADDVWEFLDSTGCDRPPIHKNDMERVAVIEEMGIKDIPFDDPVGVALKRLVVRSNKHILTFA
jgi:hypothetical protein